MPRYYLSCSSSLKIPILEVDTDEEAIEVAEKHINHLGSKYPEDCIRGTLYRIIKKAQANDYHVVTTLTPNPESNEQQERDG